VIGINDIHTERCGSFVMVGTTIIANDSYGSDVSGLQSEHPEIDDIPPPKTGQCPAHPGKSEVESSWRTLSLFFRLQSQILPTTRKKTHGPAQKAAPFLYYSTS
jgi:hypothetical protein